MLYLVGKYDPTHKMSFADFDTAALANQYLMFQMSGIYIYPPRVSHPVSELKLTHTG